MTQRARIGVLTVLLVAVTIGGYLLLFGLRAPSLSPFGGATPSSSQCEQAIARAAAIPNSADTVSDLDPAIRACASIDELERIAARYPAALDGVSAREFVGNRCAYEGTLANTPICRSLGR